MVSRAVQSMPKGCPFIWQFTSELDGIALRGLMLRMTIVRNHPSQLILAHAPWLTGYGLIVCIVACAAAGLALIAQGEVAGLLTVSACSGLPLCIFAMVIKRDQLILDAETGSVTAQRRTLFSYSRVSFPLNNLRWAEVEVLSDTERPALTFHDATPPYPLVQSYNSGNASQQAVQAINDWLRAQRR